MVKSHIPLSCFALLGQIIGILFPATRACAYVQDIFRDEFQTRGRIYFCQKKPFIIEERQHRSFFFQFMSWAGSLS